MGRRRGTESNVYGWILRSICVQNVIESGEWIEQAWCLCFLAIFNKIRKVFQKLQRKRQYWGEWKISSSVYEKKLSCLASTNQLSPVVTLFKIDKQNIAMVLLDNNQYEHSAFTPKLLLQIPKTWPYHTRWKLYHQIENYFKSLSISLELCISSLGLVISECPEQTK